MIEVGLTGLAVGVLVAAMLLVFGFAWISRWSNRKAEQKSVKRRMVCRLCLAVFESSGHETEVDCPECGARTGIRGPQALG
jgi:predicted RNA-binding Zn-ribbon protein involved in translation (DUF1610 family)